MWYLKNVCDVHVPDSNHEHNSLFVYVIISFCTQYAQDCTTPAIHT